MTGSFLGFFPISYGGTEKGLAYDVTDIRVHLWILMDLAKAIFMHLPIDKKFIDILSQVYEKSFFEVNTFITLVHHTNGTSRNRN